ncbi:DUF2920 family protein [Thiomicrorhabdus sp. ZW0627]|uniref:DUF2920 family protein n=1 Tax=Thiomicrorhabdus sp. ZW0627 TaxID=3039774 RepID=UPI0024369BE1|nr:DUF2920 family protein [Thiomicrorhabdus sp. ZW0627]MDG6773363.1 DUF2920 family protein [Thiomicrorhabdus sp. ZW0627]
MPVIEENVQFSTTPDFELGLEHCSRQTDYYLAKPVEAPKGLVVYIPGFGGDAGDYRHVFCRKVVEQYGLAAMTVDYHCFYSRPEMEGSVIYEAEDVALIEKLFLQCQLPFSGDSVEEGIKILNDHLAKNNLQVNITGTMKPGKNEYQNGGVMQALDIINAVGHVLQNQDIPSDNIILVGSSYGGYIANLAAKFAPKTFRAVFDNSSWAIPHFGYIVGREYGVPEFKEKLHSNVTLNLFIRSAWTLKKDLPYTFDGKRFHIRSFTEAQIEQYAAYRPETYFYFIHAVDDKVASTDDKIQMATQMIGNGIGVQMEVIEPDDVDGQYVKTIAHGMGLSMLTFFAKAYEHIQAHQVSSENDFMEQSKVSYDSSECRYEFDFSNLPVTAKVIEVMR